MVRGQSRQSGWISNAQQIKCERARTHTKSTTANCYSAPLNSIALIALMARFTCSFYTRPTVQGHSIMIIIHSLTGHIILCAQQLYCDRASIWTRARALFWSSDLSLAAPLKTQQEAAAPPLGAAAAASRAARTQAAHRGQSARAHHAPARRQARDGAEPAKRNGSPR